MSTFTIYGQRLKSYDPIIDQKTKEVLDDGQPKRVVLGRWDDRKLADGMAENIKKAAPKKLWKIWIE